MVLTVFHGTRRSTAILQGGFTPSPSGEFGPGMYLTDNEHTAAFYALRVARGDEPPTVLVTRVRLDKPFIVDKVDWIRMTERRTPRTVQRALKRKGYDGLVGIAINGYERQVIVWDPAQIDDAATRVHAVL